MKNKLRNTKWIAGGLEAFLAIPIVGATVILGTYWLPLFIMMAFHIYNLVMSSEDGYAKTGSIVGIIGNALGWFPGIGWTFHVVTAVLLMVEASQMKIEPEVITPKVETLEEKTNESDKID